MRKQQIADWSYHEPAPPMYTILGSDEKEYGPFDEEGIRRCIAEGRANADSPVRTPADAGWKRLSDFPQLRDMLAASQLGPPVSVPASTGTVGPLDVTLSRMSLILGILSLGCLGLLGLPALVCGHIARSRIRRSPLRYGGSSMALTGVVLGYITTLLTLLILPALLLPALAKAKANAQRVSCVSNLRQLGLAARVFAATHENTFPTNFTAMKEDLMSPRALVCDADRHHTRASSWEDFRESENVSYEFLLPGVKEADALEEIVFQCPIHGNQVYGDGKVTRIGRRSPKLER